ncbi:rRNA-processing protein NOP12 [Aspergillus ibericus CBS 121593]|uniref:Nucleolar protein 12 n=1 Tax=Aspergillus ibericus CBS 121593 TaxID=1448316 RepID=A0A395H124_9EURO|nr:hypothetical protein BO80DRAFT_381068 [Aspergillus ibericus CBS 121593]RAL01552.1 hypothetical protein BO80DRAFT_381068 [Aspergillus ibericus CBS 121593]
MGKTDASVPLLGGKASIDPTLAALFETSAGPVKAPSIPTKAEKRAAEDDEDEISELEDESSLEDEEMQEAPEASSDAGSESAQVAAEAPSRKRKRTAAEDVEDSYMRRIAKEQKKEDDKRREEKAKRQRTAEGEKKDDEEESEDEGSSAEVEESSDEDEGKTEIPKHESQAGDAESKELEKSNRTVFLGNVSSEAIKSKAAKKTLLKHLGSFLSTLPESTGPHKVESIRFRSTAFASGGQVPKRAAFAKQEVLDDTTPCTNAYAVYSTVQAARKAPAALNGTVVLDRHLRVDSVAHPSQTDHKRCVFVGNLDFIDNEAKPDDEKKKKKRAPADVEEGLWRIFNAHTGGKKEKKEGSKNGNVESVRVVRDRLTRVGKGFAYVQFYDQNCVEEALLLDGKHYPPMLPRKLRVSRAKKVLKKRGDSGSQGKSLGEADKTLQGRAGRLFGRAGAAKLKAAANTSISQNSLVFEGQRATEGASRIRVKTKSRGSKGKPNNRSSKRAAAYKAAGGWKGKTAN